jgi:PKD repeat protein
MTMFMFTRAARNSFRLVGLAIVAIALASCGIEKQSAPALSSPSEFGTSITLTAHPDTLLRDGASQSTIQITARDSRGNVLRDPLRVNVFANTGLLSAQEVDVVGGTATVTYTAPSMQEVVSTAVVSAVPVGTNADNSASRNVAISLLAPAAAVPSFNVSPADPIAAQLVTFDASGTTLGNAPCATACTYEWTFGGEATATGQVVTYRFQNETAYLVTLAVTSPGGIVTRTTRTVNVGPPVAPTAVITFSPTDPRPGDTVRFSGLSSTGANGATIVGYAWDFGNGASPASGAEVTTTFPQERTYLVRLTVTDNRGRTHTATATVNVAF